MATDQKLPSTSKQVRLIDFQVYTRPTGYPSPINEALFTAYEPIRLWLKERKIKAPFRKILISFVDEVWSARWHGQVSNAIGICEVTEAVVMPTLRRNAGDHRWVLGRVLHSLLCIARATGWRSMELEDFVGATSERPLPLIHFFDSLAKVDSILEVRCVPWLSVRPSETAVGVRLMSDKAVRDVTVLSKAGPLYLGDSFPIAKSAIRRPEFVLLDKTGKTLASIPIE
jgi:hypothetical protein